MKIWHISDTHTYHEMLTVPENIDIVVHSGDCSNSRELIPSIKECLEFIDWYAELPIVNKVLIAGNHDIAFERNLICKDKCKEKGITYLENNDVIVEGFKIWGSPLTPSFGEGWAFNRKRDKLHDLWASIPEDTDIVVSHGPAKGVLDLSYDRSGNLERCGCAALKKRVLNLEPKLFLFGHIHDCKDLGNAGYTKLATHKTIFSNGSVVTDGKFGQINHNGNIFEI